MRTARSYTQVGIGILFCFLLLLFIYHQTRDLLSGASITITSPKNGALLDEPVLTVTGITKKVAFISLNGRQIFGDEAGRFEESLLLSPGYTIITVSAEDVFKRKLEKQLEVIYRPRVASSSITATTTNSR